MTIEVKQEYQWNVNFRSPIAHTDVNSVVKELLEIQEIRGEVNPAYVIESAKNKKSALHSYFLWDNEKAANRYRLHQASELLMRIEVKVVKDGEPKIMRAFEVTKSGNNESGAKYISFDSGSSSRVKEISINDLNRTISRLESFPEYKVVVTWLKKTAGLLASIEPKESTETKKEVKPVLSAAV